MAERRAPFCGAARREGEGGGWLYRKARVLLRPRSSPFLAEVTGRQASRPPEADLAGNRPTELSADRVPVVAPALQLADDCLVIPGHAGYRTVILDLTSTTFRDSSGMHEVLVAHRLATAGRVDLRVVVPAGNLRRIFELAALHRVLALYPSLAADPVPDGQVLDDDFR